MTPQEPSHEQQVQQNLRWNFTVNVLDGGSFWFGISFSSVVTVLPLFVSQLTDSTLAIGLIPAIQRLGWMMPQLFMANYVERLPRKKFVVVLATLNERIPFLFLALMAWQVGRLSPSAALIGFFVFHSWRSFGGGATGNAWMDMIAKVIPTRMRGIFFGTQQAVGGLLGAGGAVVAGFILERYPYPLNFAICFSLTFAVLISTWGFVAATREPAIPTTKPRISQREYFRHLPGILRQDRNYSHYILSRAITTLAGMAGGFLSIYAVRVMGATAGEAGLLTATWMAAQTLANPLLGLWGDRRGHKSVLEFCGLCLAMSLAIALVAPSPVWLYPVFALAGVNLAGIILSGLSIIMEFAPPEDRPTYIGLSSTLMAPVAGLGPVLGGWLAGAFSYPVLFATALTCALLGFVLLHWTVREPRGEIME